MRSRPASVAFDAEDKPGRSEHRHHGPRHPLLRTAGRAAGKSPRRSPPAGRACDRRPAGEMPCVANRPRTSRAYSRRSASARRWFVLREETGRNSSGATSASDRAGPGTSPRRSGRRPRSCASGLRLGGERLDLEAQLMVAGRQLLCERIAIDLAVLPGVFLLQQFLLDRASRDHRAAAGIVVE